MRHSSAVMRAYVVLGEAVCPCSPLSCFELPLHPGSDMSPVMSLTSLF